VPKFRYPVETHNPDNVLVEGSHSLHTNSIQCTQTWYSIQFKIIGLWVHCVFLLLLGGLLILADAFKPIWADKTEPIPLFPDVHSPENVPPSGSWWAGWIDFWHNTCYTHYRTVESLITNQPGLALVHRNRYLVPFKKAEDLGAISNSITLVSPGVQSVCKYPIGY
jgi:hypothetical protein